MIYLTVIKTFLGRVPIWVYPALALLLWGGCARLEAQHAKEKLQIQTQELLQEKADAEAVARVKEAALGDINMKASNDLSKSKAETQRLARDTAGRLRAIAAAWAASQAAAGTGASCGDDGAPVVSVLRNEDRESFVALGEEADHNADKLRACQAWAKGVKEILR